MKKISLLLMFSLFLVTLQAQDGQAPLAKGDKQINFGLGFTNSGLPVYVGMDFAVHRDVTLGPVLGVRFNDNDGHSYFNLNFRTDYHFNRIIGIPPNWDFYAGGHIGFLAGNDFLVDWGIQVGGRWYWNDRWGLNFEIGGGNVFGTTFGLSVKL